MINTNWNFGVELEFSSTCGDQYTVARRLTEWFARQGVSRICVGKPYGYSNSRTEWTCKPDGSVNGCEGLELVPPVLTGPDGLYELALVVEKFLGPMVQANEISVDSSCGLHVHHSGAGLTETLVNNIYKAYTSDGGETERSLYSQCNAHRQNNSYCRKAYHRGLIPSFDTMSQGVNLRPFNIICARYFGLNLNSYWVRGTVEFRMYQGTLDAQEIVNWVLFTTATLKQLMTGTVQLTGSVSTLTHKGQANWIDEAMRAGNLTVTEIARVTGYSRARIQLHIHHVRTVHGFNPLRG